MKKEHVSISSSQKPISSWNETAQWCLSVWPSISLDMSSAQVPGWLSIPPLKSAWNCTKTVLFYRLLFCTKCNVHQCFKFSGDLYFQVDIRIESNRYKYIYILYGCLVLVAISFHRITSRSYPIHIPFIPHEISMFDLMVKSHWIQQ